jgi:phytanoyl-CoA hydroxylase
VVEVTPAHKEQFAESGYLVIPGVLDPERDIEPVLAELESLLDDLAQRLHADGRIASTYSGWPFAARVIQICRETGSLFAQHFDINLPQKGIRPDTPINVGPAIFGFLTHPALLDVVEAFVGPEIYSNPVQHIRVKPPVDAVPGQYDVRASRTSWHQDNGVILPEADASDILTVWVPLTPATLENGCLRVIPGSHREGVVPHCPTAKGVAIPDQLLAMEQAQALPMEPGSVLLMTRRTMHGSLDNVTPDQVRISCDLRYQPVGQPTGRPTLPGFVARSREHPERVLKDPEAWARSWYETRARLAAEENPSYNRWRADAPMCA